MTQLKAEWKWIVAIVSLMLTTILIMTALIKRSRRTTIPVTPTDDDNSRKYIPPAQLEGLTRPSHYDITGKLAWISRAPGENSKDTATICIKDDVISRDHALIQYRDNAYWISDRGSINGTFVNDEKITGERALHNGDRIRFAKYEFRFILPHRTDMADTMLIQSDNSDERTELISLDDRASPQPTALPSPNPSPQNHDDEEATIIRPVERNGSPPLKQQR
ncbi:FHA domain-containing protein [Nitrosococcus wardiae]|uniref:FHA domain-containing protein n=1 Tax=Nitrosococcus wardiae TaxID=1814290 RepID=A0A4P7BVJ8_9GAMM|nr:FHA domain-containing protein [Nitrosococcus wardiae]QBQ53104.1 FHA domain-containing protein [Nitrosococcus wardiae]